MGLTAGSTGLGAFNARQAIEKELPGDLVIALAGNPNVGKSTVFNALTGLNQHTGNWPGKTVASAQGIAQLDLQRFLLVDIPGTYSLLAHSAEEEIARNFICFGSPDATVVVCDATCLERNLNLALQITEVCPKTIVVVNLMDEARKKGIYVDVPELEQKLGVPVIPCAAREGTGLQEVLKAVKQCCKTEKQEPPAIRYLPVIEQELKKLQALLSAEDLRDLPSRWVSLRLLEDDASLHQELTLYLEKDLLEVPAISQAIQSARKQFMESGLSIEHLQDTIVSCIVLHAEEIACDCVQDNPKSSIERDRKIDRFLTSRKTGIPAMLLLLGVVLWLTITGANYPSELLSHFLFGIQDKLTFLFHTWGLPEWLHGILVLGVFRTLAWVVAVMLPPMAIFFPLFTLLEDVGYLPRIAFNLDHYFHKCGACGKQALTMAMGFGCNAAGVIGCRIIDSPRERLIAIITNNFVPCNGRFPPPRLE